MHLRLFAWPMQGSPADSEDPLSCRPGAPLFLRLAVSSRTWGSRRHPWPPPIMVGKNPIRRCRVKSSPLRRSVIVLKKIWPYIGIISEYKNYTLILGQNMLLDLSDREGLVWSHPFVIWCKQSYKFNRMFRQYF